MQKFGIPAEQAGDGSPDLVWLRAGGGEWHPYAAGDRLPFGVEAFPEREHNDMVLWVESHHAVIAGDTLADFGGGLEIPLQWLRDGVRHESIVEGMRPLDKPVEHVLAAHGGPTDRAALERALSSSQSVRRTFPARPRAMRCAGLRFHRRFRASRISFRLQASIPPDSAHPGRT